MLYKQLGDTDVSIPEIGLGTWQYRGGVEPLRRGLEAGAWFIDTAESYGSEEVVGQAIAGVREKVFLATKVSPRHFRHAEVLKAADRSLERLGVDHIDLYQLHAPNPAIPIAETMGAMAGLVEAGKVRFIGVSNFSVRELAEAQRVLEKHRIVANQVRYNLVDRTIESDLLGYCRAHRITIVAYSPLAHWISVLFQNDPDGALRAVARNRGKTVAQVAINWCLCKDGVVAIPRSDAIERVVENCRASDWRLEPDEIERLEWHVRCWHRSGFEALLGRIMPPGAKRVIKGIGRRLPACVSRRFR